MTTDPRIVMRSTADLKPYSRNARTHTPDQIQKIIRSIQEFGWTNPILVDREGMIVAGHARLAAALAMGLPEVPTIGLGHLTPAQARAYVIADNQLGLDSSWDEDILRVELTDLQALDYDLSLTGFDSDELERLLAGEEPDSTRGNTGEDDVPEVPDEPVSRLGDIWVMGKHRVMCGDSVLPETYAALMGDSRAAMIFTDPPYGVNYANNPKDKMQGTHRPILNDNLGEDFGAFLKAALSAMMPYCDGGICVAMSSSELDTLMASFRASGGKWSTFIIWAKHTFTLGRADYQRQYEPILYGWRDGAKHYWCGARDQGDVWQIKKPHKNDLHPTMKPVELVDRAIRNSSRPGDGVLDPFGGSGSTVIAAERSGRRSWIVELDPKYVDVIVQRWQEFTGETAYLEGGGSFAAVQLERRAAVPADTED